MYRAMIVDDEIGVRESLKAKINWNSLGFQVVAEAANGQEALSCMQQHKLDVVITDIQMPVMNGVQFFNECSSRYLNTKIIVLSGYSDFEYTKAAIKAGIVDYLIKPVARKELHELLVRIKEELDREKEEEIKRSKEDWQLKQLLSEQREQFLYQLVKNEWTSSQLIQDRLVQLKLQDINDYNSFQFVAAEMKIPEKRIEQNSSRLDLLYLSFRLLCKELANSTSQVLCFQDLTFSNMMHFILMSDSTPVLEAQSGEFVVKLEEKINHILKLDMKVGIGKAVHSLEEFKNGYASSLLDWSLKVQGNAGSVHITQVTQDFSTETERRMVVEIEKGNMQPFQSLLVQLLFPEKQLSIINFSFLAVRVVIMIRSLAARYSSDQEKLQELSLACQFAIWQFSSQDIVFRKITQFADYTIQLIQTQKNTSGEGMIGLICKYIQENYCYELTLTTLSEQFHFNEAYLSSLFKTHARMNFSDYLVMVRMKKAEELIKDTDLKLTDIAQLVGYSNSSYFSTAFKKFYHASPSVYREQLKKTEHES
ncbi:MAG: response regulator transcription factor [Bacillota bacterium]